MSIAVFGLWYYCRYGGNYRPVLRQTFHPAAIAGIVMLMPGTQYLTTYIMSFVASLFPHWMDAYESLLETAVYEEKIISYTLSLLYGSGTCSMRNRSDNG